MTAILYLKRRSNSDGKCVCGNTMISLRLLTMLRLVVCLEMSVGDLFEPCFEQVSGTCGLHLLGQLSSTCTFISSSRTRLEEPTVNTQFSNDTNTGGFQMNFWVGRRMLD